MRRSSLCGPCPKNRPGPARSPAGAAPGRGTAPSVAHHSRTGGRRGCRTARPPTRICLDGARTGEVVAEYQIDRKEALGSTAEIVEPDRAGSPSGFLLPTAFGLLPVSQGMANIPGAFPSLPGGGHRFQVVAVEQIEDPVVTLDVI